MEDLKIGEGKESGGILAVEILKKALLSREPEWRELDPYAAQYGRLVKHHGAEPNQQIAGNREVGDDLVPRALCEGRMPARCWLLCFHVAFFGMRLCRFLHLKPGRKLQR
jgi:hypothetical protein